MEEVRKDLYFKYQADLSFVLNFEETQFIFKADSIAAAFCITDTSIQTFALMPWVKKLKQTFAFNQNEFDFLEPKNFRIKFLPSKFLNRVSKKRAKGEK